MRQIPNYGDQRQLAACVYCGAGTETRDHVPSRAFLDSPYPENLPVVPACQVCNAGFSQDEEYVACLLDCVLAGAVDPDRVPRPKVKRILREKPALLRRLAAAHSPAASSFEIEAERVRRVALKLARGHAAYELNEPQFDGPTQVAFEPLATLSDLRAFELPPIADIWPEVGSRAMQRLAEAGGPITSEWIVVQEGRYRYLAAATRVGVIVRSVLSEYLGCEVAWRNQHGRSASTGAHENLTNWPRSYQTALAPRYDYGIRAAGAW